MMFDWLDVEEKGDLDFEEFLHGFDILNENITGKAMLQIEFAMKQRSHHLEQELEALNQAVNVIDQQSEGLHDDILNKVREAIKVVVAEEAQVEEVEDGEINNGEINIPMGGKVIKKKRIKRQKSTSFAVADE